MCYFFFLIAKSLKPRNGDTLTVSSFTPDGVDVRLIASSGLAPSL